MKRYLALVATLLLTLTGASSSAAESGPPRCTKKLYRQADAALTPVENWSALHRYYRAYGDCRDGYLGEGVSEKVETLLTEHWETLPELAGLARNDLGFERFVLAQLGETNSAGFTEQLIALSDQSCPKGAEVVCRRLSAAARR